MPVPTVTKLRSYEIRITDDLLIDPETKELSEFGEPFPLRNVEPKDVWTYLTVENPIGRKKVWKVDRYASVYVIRMVKTPEDIRREINERLTVVALGSQRDYWTERNKLANDMLAGVKVTRRSSYGYRYHGQETVQEVGGADVLARSLENLREYEVFAEQWAAVAALTEEGEHDNASALAVVIERLKDRIIQGYGYNAGDMDHYRSFIRRNERYAVALEDAA